MLPLISGYSQKFKYATYNGGDLPFKKVNQVLEDTRSYMWLATDQGLYRFDGTNFEDYNTTLESKYIRSLVQLDDNTILFSNDTGVYQLYYENEEVVIDSFLEVDEAVSDLEYPTNLLLDSQDRLWIGQLDGSVFMHKKEQGSSMRFQLNSGVNTPKILFGEDNYTTVWAFIPALGLYYYDEEEERFKEEGNYGKYRHFQVVEDQILLAGEEVIQLQLGENHNVLEKDYLLPGGQTFTYIAVDKIGLIFLASEEGLFTLNRAASNHLREIFGSNDPHRVEELAFKEVNQIYFSSDQVRIGGKIWVCTPQGLSLLYSGFFKSVSGMAMDNTLSLGTTVRNEILVSQGNIFRINNTEGDDPFDEFSTNRIRVTAITSNGPFVWLGTSDGTVIRAREGVRTQFDISKRGAGIFFMYEDSEGGIWFCQAPTDQPIIGVGKLNRRGEITEYSTQKGLESRVLVLDEGGKSELYAAGIGLDSYLYKYDRESDRFENKSLPFPFKVNRNFEVHDISVDSRGIVWMATTDGLLKYDTERIQRVGLGELTQSEIRSVCTLPDGSIWMATDTSGMIHLDDNGNYVLFDEKSGTPSKIASYRAMVLDNANRLWAGTAEGVVYSVMPFPAPLSTKKPSLNKVVINAREKEFKGTLEIAKEDVADFYFTSMSYPGDENQIQYKYYPSNLPEDEIEDVNWQRGEIDSRVRIQMSNSGKYTLEVRAQKPGGYSWSIPVSVTFKVVKPWYATVWGIFLLIVLGVVVFGYGIRFFSKKKTAQLESLLFNKEKELTAKEEQLISQEDVMEHQKEALKNTGVNIDLLHSLMRQFPKRANWKKVLPILSKLVELPTGMDAFEVGFLKKSTVQYIGYQRGSAEMKRREVEFNEKENLTSYVLNHKKALLIKNNEKDSGRFIGQYDKRGFMSRLYVPFEQSKGEEVVLCAYGKDEDRFSEQDLTILQILATFLSSNVTDQIK
ncbi:MAG: ligand-binding sensor domain-containing protein [Flavobacteriaceae bacterium]